MSFGSRLRRPFEQVGTLLRAGAVAGLLAGGSLAVAVAARSGRWRSSPCQPRRHPSLARHDDSVRSSPSTSPSRRWLGAGSVGKEGLANLLSTLLDEGAADLDSEAYQKKLADLAIKLGFDAGGIPSSGSMQTLAANTPQRSTSYASP